MSFALVILLQFLACLMRQGPPHSLNICYKLVLIHFKGNLFLMSKIELCKHERKVKLARKHTAIIQCEKLIVVNMCTTQLFDDASIVVVYFYEPPVKWGRALRTMAASSGSVYSIRQR